MYSAITANKWKTFFLFFLFIGIITAISLPFAYAYHNYSIILFTVAGTLIYAIIQYFCANKIALGLSGAREIQKRDNPRLWRTIENLSITTGLPMPRVYVINNPTPNAFTTGRDPNHALIAVTTGLLDLLDDTELEAVIAHEIAHIKNYDIRVAMMVFALVGSITLVAEILYYMSFGNGRNSNPVVLIAGLIGVVVAPIVAVIVQSAISRQREYLADSTAVLTTRYPDGLITALQKIETASTTSITTNRVTAKDKALASLWFSEPKQKTKAFTSLMSTHPPTAKRIERLQENSVRF